MNKRRRTRKKDLRTPNLRGEDKEKGKKRKGAEITGGLGVGKEEKKRFRGSA